MSRLKAGKRAEIFKKRGGEGRMKRMIIAVTIVAVMCGLALAAGEDNVQLYVHPAWSMSVNISSTTGFFAGGTAITLGESRTLCVGWVCNDGNVSSRWQKQTANTGSTANDWSLVTTGTPGSNQFRLLAVTTSTAASPTFSGGAAFGLNSNICITGEHGSTNTSVAASYYDLTEGGNGSPTHGAFNVESTTRSLWVSIMMPKDITSSTDKTITLSINALVP